MLVRVEANTAAFQRQIDRVKHSVDDDLRRLMASSSKKLFTDIVEATPVDTGNAQAHWELNKVDKYEYEITNDVPYINVLEFGGYRGKGPKTRHGVSGYTVDYVSKQAPKGMVRRSIEKLLQKLKGAGTYVGIK